MFSPFIAFAFHVATLEVGPGKPFERIEAAVAAAHPGDSILVYPDPSGYPKTALRIRTASLTIRGVGSKPVEVKGDGYKKIKVRLLGGQDNDTYNISSGRRRKTEFR